MIKKKESCYYLGVVGRYKKAYTELLPKIQRDVVIVSGGSWIAFEFAERHHLDTLYRQSDPEMFLIHRHVHVQQLYTEIVGGVFSREQK